MTSQACLSGATNASCACGSKKGLKKRTLGLLFSNKLGQITIISNISDNCALAPNI